MNASTVSHQPRSGESAATAPIGNRASRVFRLPSGWYFHTREKVPLGPFASEEQTEAAVQDFLEFLERAPDHVRRLFVQSRGSPSLNS